MTTELYDFEERQRNLTEAQQKLADAESAKKAAPDAGTRQAAQEKINALSFSLSQIEAGVKSHPDYARYEQQAALRNAVIQAGDHRLTLDNNMQAMIGDLARAAAAANWSETRLQDEIKKRMEGK